MRDIDFERRFDLGTNNSLRRLAPNLRVDRQSIRQLNDRQTLAKLLKSKEFEYLKKLELKEANEDIIKKLVEEQKLKRIAGARRRGSLRKSREQQIRETQSYQRGERREAGEEEVRVRGSQQERQNLQQLQNEILNIRQALNNENMNIRQQLLQQQQNQVQRDAYLLQYLGGFNPGGQDVVRAVRDPQAPVRLPDIQGPAPRAGQLAQAAGVLPPAAPPPAAAPPAAESPIAESPRPQELLLREAEDTDEDDTDEEPSPRETRRKRTLEELDDNELTDLFIKNQNDGAMAKRILDEIERRNLTEQERVDKAIAEAQRQPTLSPASSLALDEVVAEDPDLKISKTRKLIDALSPRNRGRSVDESGASIGDTTRQSSVPITAFELDKQRSQSRLRNLAERFTRRKTREDTPFPEDERERSPDYVDALESIKEEEDDRLVVEKIHRAASIERGRLKQAQEAEELAEERGFQPRQRGARGLADARRVEPEDFPRTLPADTSGINLLQQSIEGGGIEPLELSSVLNTDIVAEANRLQEEGKLSQTQQDSQSAIDTAENSIRTITNWDRRIKK